jgi:hypothetical protein
MPMPAEFHKSSMREGLWRMVCHLALKNSNILKHLMIDKPIEHP